MRRQRHGERRPQELSGPSSGSRPEGRRILLLRSGRWAYRLMNIERQFAARTPVGAYDRAGVGTSDAPARAPRTLPGLDLTTEDDIGGPGALAFDATHVTFDVTGLRVRAAVLACSLLLLGAVFPAIAPAASIPGQGLFDECPLRTINETWQDCINNMPALRAAGFTHVLNANAGAGSDVEPVSDNIRAYADAAAANRVGIIWHIGSRNTSIDTDRNAAPRAFISEMRSHPATLGYYIADEPPAENEAIVEAWAQEIERIDPNHPTFIVSYGWGAGSWRSGAAPFWDAGNGIDFLGGDVYPITGDNPDLLSVKKVIGAVGEQARASGKQPWAILQAFPWSEVWPCGGPYVSSDEDYLAEGWCKSVELDRWPTRNEMLTMRDYALEGHPAMITWFIWSTMREEAHQRGINWRDYGPWLDLQAVINAPYTPRATPRDTLRLST